MNIPGRSCPLDYHIPAELYENRSEIKCEILYVVGGLYGNLEALKSLNQQIKKEKNVLVVFNGDMHWFDKTIEDFQNIEKMAESHVTLLGNVEAELIRNEDIGVGCGCSYPDCVFTEAVNRSNMIHAELKSVIGQMPKMKSILAKRSRVAIAKIGEQRIAITHGDEQSLAGWKCSRESLIDELRQAELNTWMKEQGFDVLATTHTCAPAAILLKHGVVINNGAAGMPNFKGEIYGLISRISLEPNPEAIYRCKIGKLFVEAVPLRYNQKNYLTWFDRLWSADSPAAISYRERIIFGPDDTIEKALLGGFVRKV